MSSDVTNDELIEILADGLLCESDRCLSRVPNACTCALAAERLKEALGKLETLTHELEQTVEALEAANSTCDRAADRMIELTKERDGYASKLDRYRSALERIIEAWDGDSESMHNDPAVIAREALSDE